MAQTLLGTALLLLLEAWHGSESKPRSEEQSLNPASSHMGPNLSLGLGKPLGFGAQAGLV